MASAQGEVCTIDNRSMRLYSVQLSTRTASVLETYRKQRGIRNEWILIDRVGMLFFLPREHEWSFGRERRRRVRERFVRVIELARKLQHC